jgi:valyl-tRNA synthetase
MDKIYDHKKVEEKIYKEWEEKGYFSPDVNPNGEPYAIVLPPTNANGALHFGHAMYVVEDILVRFHRMKGDKTLWLPGTDHAGIETQFVFEKKLREEGKSRLDFERKDLFEMIKQYVDENRGGIEKQLRRLGFSLDWNREKYTLDNDIVEVIYDTFKKLFDDGLVYRAKRLVNYCTHDGTSFSDLEVVYEERQNPLYYIKYGPLVLATTRPETKFGDTAVAVNPDDKRYQEYIGKELEIETVLGKAKIKVIADKMVDPEFGTGVVKITPAHDFDDFEVAQRHNLPMVQVIGFDGKMNEKARKFAGLYAKQARKVIVEEMQQKGLIEKIDENYVHRIGLCYKCKNPLEPLPLEQWFIKMEPLSKPAIEAVKKKNIKIFPKSFEKIYYQILENYKDWNISRQIVWGIRIPAWQCLDCNKWTVTKGEAPDKCEHCESKKLKQDEDTFDTWFSSGQWPYATLKTTNSLGFYPLNVMETGYDILRAWVARMVMLGIYIQKKQGVEDVKKQIPFKNIVLHGLVNDPLGKKMSKSKGNVVNPIEIADQYGADAIRFALVYGTAFGNDQALSYPKLQAMRNFTNKLWNIGRFIEMQFNSELFKEKELQFYSREIKKDLCKEDLVILEDLNNFIKNTTASIDTYRFHDAVNGLYDFIWHKLADVYIEQIKERLKNGDEKALIVLRHVWINCLKLLHPFMPFITEELWAKILKRTERPLIISKWPTHEE